MRIHVQLDVTKPLLHLKKLIIESYPVAWLRFSYQRLPDVCFCCGVMGHNHWECEMWEEKKESCERDRFPYGSWLHAGQTGNNGTKAPMQSPWRVERSLDNAMKVNSQLGTEVLFPIVEVTPETGNKDDGTKTLPRESTGQKHLHESRKASDNEMFRAMLQKG